ncbi:hypothetical protein N9N67_06980, partial [Bacteriovoracaceae bacterium]|nr:hypothetical protein [Bacteriovoracaceae bacterium]
MKRNFLILFLFSINQIWANNSKQFKQDTYCFQDKSCTNISLEIETNTDHSINPHNESKQLQKSMYAQLNVSSPKKQKKFAIVQFIRGCFYGTQWVNQIQQQVYFPFNRDHYGQKDIRFSHPDWTIDTVDADPIYWSSKNLENPIENYLIVPPKKALVTEKTSTIRLRNNPHYAGPLYIMDRPSGIRAKALEWVDSSLEIYSINASFEFET